MKPLNVDDLVACVEPSDGLVMGKLYRVVSADTGSRCVKVAEPEDSTELAMWYWMKRFAPYTYPFAYHEDIPGGDIVPEELKVGDHVICRNNAHNRTLVVGEEYVVTGCNPTLVWLMTVDGRHLNNRYFRHRFVKLQRRSLLTAPKRLFKVLAKVITMGRCA